MSVRPYRDIHRRQCRKIHVGSVPVGGDAPITETIELTPRARKVLGLAIEEASRLDHPFVGTGHLLLGLLREGNGIAVAILEARDLTSEELRTARLTKSAAVDRGGGEWCCLLAHQPRQHRLGRTRS